MGKLEALREPRQIITLILPTVKVLTLGCERLPPPPPKKQELSEANHRACRSAWGKT